MTEDLDLASLREENARLKARIAGLEGAIDPQLGSHLLAALDSMREGLQVLDRDFRYLYLNEAAARQGRRPRHELIGRTLPEMYPGVEATELWQQLTRCLQEGIAHRMDNEFAFPDGSSEWFELRIEPIPEGLLLLSISIGERRNLEAQLAHSQKMEAIGRLAGGIAHDFNNMLTVISSYAHLIGDQLGEHSPARADLDQISEAADRATRLTRQLLALGRKQVLRPELLNVNESLSALRPMLSRLLGEAVELQLSLSNPIGRVRIDAGQLDQIILNLAANARDAMPDGGKFSIRTENASLGEEYCEQHPDVVPGSYVVIVVSDSGCGIDCETQARMFEPFYTTKAAGKGTGLGLSITHGIVRQSGGHIWVYSERGHGTTFKLYFPHAVSETVAPASQPARPRTLPRGAQTVLVVDDEVAVRSLCARVLSAQGYTVLEADGPADALRFAVRYSGPIHALLSDVVMPEQSGPQLFAKLVVLRPELRVLFMSGYVDHGGNAALEGYPCIEKPFTPEQLSRALHIALVGRPPDD